MLVRCVCTERSASGLDAASPGDATFERIVRGFKLKPSKRALARIAIAPAAEEALAAYKMKQQALGEAAAKAAADKKAAKEAAKEDSPPNTIQHKRARYG